MDYDKCIKHNCTELVGYQAVAPGDLSFKWLNIKCQGDLYACRCKLLHHIVIRAGDQATQLISNHCVFDMCATLISASETKIIWRENKHCCGQVQRNLFNERFAENSVHGCSSVFSSKVGIFVKDLSAK